jgi:hypothetical protein
MASPVNEAEFEQAAHWLAASNTDEVVDAMRPTKCN